MLNKIIELAPDRHLYSEKSFTQWKKYSSAETVHDVVSEGEMSITKAVDLCAKASGLSHRFFWFAIKFHALCDKDKVGTYTTAKFESIQNRRRMRDEITSSIRWKVWKRDNFTCNNYGKNPNCTRNTGLTVDHIIPASKGGSNDLENLQTLCKRCNSLKKDKV